MPAAEHKSKRYADVTDLDEKIPYDEIPINTYSMVKRLEIQMREAPLAVVEA